MTRLITIVCALLLATSVSALDLPYTQHNEAKIGDRQYGYVDVYLSQGTGIMTMKFSNGRPLTQVRLYAQVDVLDDEGGTIASCQNNHHLPMPGRHATERTTSCSFDFPPEKAKLAKRVAYSYWSSDEFIIEVEVNFNTGNREVLSQELAPTLPDFTRSCKGVCGGEDVRWSCPATQSCYLDCSTRTGKCVNSEY